MALLGAENTLNYVCGGIIPRRRAHDGLDFYKGHALTNAPIASRVDVEPWPGEHSPRREHSHSDYGGGHASQEPASAARGDGAYLLSPPGAAARPGRSARG